MTRRRLGSRIGVAAGRAARTACVLGLAIPAAAQTRPPSRPAPIPAQRPVTVRAFADAGLRTFTAAKSFEAVLGRASAPVYGGGVELLLPYRTFVAVHVSRFREAGERVFVANGEIFPLGIGTTISDTPIEVSAGYRFVRPRSRLVPFIGGGLDWHRYSETSEFAVAEEDVSEVFQGYHVLGGVEFRLSRWVSAAGTAQWTTVPDALGTNPTSVAGEFGESNLGGATLLARIVVGR
jgi:hypothetical protein